MISFPATPTINIWFPSLPPTFKLKKEQRPEEQKLTLYSGLSPFTERLAGSEIVGHQLAKDSLSWINCKRREKSSKCFLHSGGVGTRVGEGSPAVQGCPERLLPSTGSN